MTSAVDLAAPLLKTAAATMAAAITTAAPEAEPAAATTTAAPEAEPVARSGSNRRRKVSRPLNLSLLWIPSGSIDTAGRILLERGDWSAGLVPTMLVRCR